MPELPEVETFARQIRPHILDKKIKAITITAKGERLVTPVSREELEKHLVGYRFISLKRHGKFLIFDISNEWHIVAHLRMSGRFTITKSEPDQSIHNRLFLEFEDGTYLNFIDIRRFATFHLIKDTSSSKGLQILGPDALDGQWTGKTFYTQLQKHQAGIYKTLLNQEVISGIGNIYANESLFCSGISPFRSAAGISPKEAAKLLSNIIKILNDSLEYKGTTLLDKSYKDIEGNTGEFRNRLMVYGRSDESCKVCGTKIRRIKSGGRSVFFCDKCQDVKELS